MVVCTYRGSKQPFLYAKRAGANLGVYKLTGAILIGGVRWHQTFPGWWAAGGWAWFPAPACGLQPKGGGQQGGWVELVGSIPALWPPAEKWCRLQAFQLSGAWAGPWPKSGMALSIQLFGWPTVNCSRAVHHWWIALFQMWACFVIRAVHTAGTSMGTMAASFEACQWVSLWSLKLSGYCATAWWHTVSVCELAACASALSIDGC